MIRKILFTLAVIVLITGCEATYNLDVSDEFFENTIIKATNNQDIEMIKNVSKNTPAYMTDSFDPEDTDFYDDVEYYTYSYLDNNTLSISYRFGNNYNLSTIANQSMPKLEVNVGKTIRLHATGDFDCFNTYESLEKLTINIKVPYEIVYENADFNSDDVYTWVIRRDELSSTIDIEYKNPDYKENEKPESHNNKSSNGDKNNQDNNPKNNNSSKSDNIYLFLLSGLFFIALFGIIIFINKFKKNN